MPQPIAKLFAIGGSQAVRLPAEFRFDGITEVYIRRDEATGDVILSTHAPADWHAFMQLRWQLEPFLRTPSPRANKPRINGTKWRPASVATVSAAYQGSE